MKSHKFKHISLDRYGFPRKASIKKRMPKKKPDHGLVKKEEFNEFAKWAALPSPLRNPPTQVVWGKEHYVDENTLLNWKKRPEFWLLVAQNRQEWAKDKTSDVVSGLFRTASRGKAPEVKLWFQLVEDWSEKSVVQVDPITVMAIKGISSEEFNTLMPAKDKANAQEAEIVTDTSKK